MHISFIWEQGFEKGKEMIPPKKGMTMQQAESAGTRPEKHCHKPWHRQAQYCINCNACLKH